MFLLEIKIKYKIIHLPFPNKKKKKVLKAPILCDIAIARGDPPTMLKNIFTTLLTINAIEGPLALS